MNAHPVRRCAPCDRNWPNTKTYNLCPRCQRCTFAATDDEYPDREQATKDAERYERVRAFDAECDAKAAEREFDTLHLLELAYADAPAIPDPPGCSDLPPLPAIKDPQTGLPTSQRIDYWDGRGDA